MLTINCTGKLRKEINFEIEDSLEVKRDDFYNWYAHLITINRRKTAILMNVETRYSIILYGLKKADFEDLNQLIKDAIRDNFKAEGIKSFYIDKYMEKIEEVKYSKTYNRSIISQINNFKRYVEAWVEDFLPTDKKNMIGLGRKINRVPILKLEAVYPIEKLRKVFNKRMGRSYSNVYSFKIALKGIEPEIWRRIEVPEDYNFWDLHVAIQDAMGWLDYHLHEFRMKDSSTGKELEIGIPDQDFGFNVLTGWEEKIVDYFTMENKTMNYIYDFGDYWEHTIELEDIYPGEEDKEYPCCLAGARACPPEDSGGVPGYYRVVEILNDPEHEEYEFILDWLEGEYDLECFEPGAIDFDNPRERLSNIFSSMGK